MCVCSGEGGGRKGGGAGGGGRVGGRRVGGEGYVSLRLGWGHAPRGDGWRRSIPAHPSPRLQRPARGLDGPMLAAPKITWPTLTWPGFGIAQACTAQARPDTCLPRLVSGNGRESAHLRNGG